MIDKECVKDLIQFGVIIGMGGDAIEYCLNKFKTDWPDIYPIIQEDIEMRREWARAGHATEAMTKALLESNEADIAPIRENVETLISQFPEWSQAAKTRLSEFYNYQQRQRVLSAVLADLCTAKQIKNIHYHLEHNYRCRIFVEEFISAIDYDDNHNITLYDCMMCNILSVPLDVNGTAQANQCIFNLLKEYGATKDYD